MKKQKCVYDYANKCDCSEDDRCGCTYPNNMSGDFECEENPKHHGASAPENGKQTR